jgi:hypothetical protein
MKKCEVISEIMAIYTGQRYVELEDKVFNAMCEKFGTFGFSWYFVTSTLIKYFDGEWKYTNYKPSFIDGWGIF